MKWMTSLQRMKLPPFLARVADLIAAPIRQNLTFACFIYLLGLITLLVEVTVLHWKFPKFNVFSLALDVYLLCLLLMSIPSKLRQWGRGTVAVVLYVLAVVDAFCVHNFYAVIGPEILNVCLETTGRESSEFAAKYIRPGVLFSGVGVVMLCGLFHVFSTLRFKVHSLLVTLVVVASAAIALHSRVNMMQLLMVDSVVELDSHISNQSLNTPLNNLLFSVKTRVLAAEGLRDLTAFQETVSVDSCSCDAPTTMVLIIGESYIKRHSQLYGYEKATTPLQMRRAADSTLTVFSDVMTPSNLTSVVFKHVLSLHSMDDTADWSRYPLFPVLFRKAGRHVTFLTNQFVKTVTQDAFNITGGLFLNDTRLSQLQFDERNAASHQYDMELLGDYTPQSDSTASLVIFHLAGQHIDFYKRCPDSLRCFSANDYRHRADLNDSERQLVADYDNATYYNDMVVDSIVRMFSADDAVVIYMPDHGEECFDELHRMGRLPQSDLSDERVVRAEYQIPFWIWCSQPCIERRPGLMRRIRAAKDRPFLTDDLPHMLLSLAGIHCRYYCPERDLLSSQFRSDRRRLP